MAKEIKLVLTAWSTNTYEAAKMENKMILAVFGVLAVPHTQSFLQVQLAYSELIFSSLSCIKKKKFMVHLISLSMSLTGVIVSFCIQIGSLHGISSKRQDSCST